MVSPNRIAEVASVIGEPARAAMLSALMDGRALTAAELAAVAGITPQTASAHLARLVGAELIGVAKQGRHRYHRLAGPSVARLLEGLMQHAAADPTRRPTPRFGPRDEALRRARTCYDHLAGRLGVAIADALVANGHVEIDDEAGMITDSGEVLRRRRHSASGRDGDGSASAAAAVSALPRLERASAPSRRPTRRRDLRRCLRGRLAASGRRRPRRRGDAERASAVGEAVWGRLSGRRTRDRHNSATKGPPAAKHSRQSPPIECQAGPRGRPSRRGDDGDANVRSGGGASADGRLVARIASPQTSIAGLACRRGARRRGLADASARRFDDRGGAEARKPYLSCAAARADRRRGALGGLPAGGGAVLRQAACHARG